MLVLTYVSSTTGKGLPCPGCGKPLLANEVRVTVADVWQVWHEECFNRSLLE